MTMTLETTQAALNQTLRYHSEVGAWISRKVLVYGIQEVIYVARSGRDYLETVGLTQFDGHEMIVTYSDSLDYWTLEYVESSADVVDAAGEYGMHFKAAPTV